MRWPAIMGASIAGHALVIAALPMGEGAAPAANHGPVVTIEALPAEAQPRPSPMDVVFLSEPETAAATGAAAGSATATATASAHRIRSHAGARGGAATEPAAEVAGKPSRFGTMRFPGAERAPSTPTLDLSLSGAVLNEIMNRPVPEIPTPTGELRANKDGTYTKNDSVYVATIGEDGTVSFEDKPNLRVGLKIPSVRALKKHLSNWVEDPYSGNLGDVDEGQSQDDDDDDVFIIPIIVGSFDLTDAAMRLMGDDPYNAKKLAFLDRTREERAEIGRKHRKAQLARSEAYILDHATELWERDDFTLAEKRELLFELWDECAETGDTKQVEAGERARAALLRFIEVKLPRGGDDAYTAEEIRTLDARRTSEQHFRPY